MERRPDTCLFARDDMAWQSDLEVLRRLKEGLFQPTL
jgi:hypothetical protein